MHVATLWLTCFRRFRPRQVHNNDNLADKQKNNSIDPDHVYSANTATAWLIHLYTKSYMAKYITVTAPSA